MKIGGDRLRKNKLTKKKEADTGKRIRKVLSFKVI